MRVRIRDVVAPVFWPVHRAIARGTVQELVAKGGRGSGKSSYISIELVLQLLRHPACHAVVLRKIGGISGDGHGAGIEVGESLLLAAALLLAHLG